MNLNFGSGSDPKTEGWLNVDRLPLPNVDVVHNLMDFPYPFAANSAKRIHAIDVIEHLDHYTPQVRAEMSAPSIRLVEQRPTIVAFIEECYRILVLGGELYIHAPGYDAEFMWDDPTHVRGFTAKSFDFFDPSTVYGQNTGFYSPAKFIRVFEQLPNRNLRFWLTKQ